MGFNLGLKAIKKLVVEENALHWHKAKLSAPMFKGESEVKAFQFVEAHVSKYHELPKLVTLIAQIPEAQEVDCPEPSKYYLDNIDNRYFHGLVNAANLDSQAALKEDKNDSDKAVAIMKAALDKITQQKFRHRILDVSAEAPQMVLTAYHNTFMNKNTVRFFWPYLDAMSGGAEKGDVISFIGRPAAGKTQLTLRTAIKNWQAGQNVLFASMEMNALAITQRLAAMYAHTNLTQLKSAAYATPSYKKLVTGLMGISNEKAKLYVVDGKLAAHVDDIYMLASQLKCSVVFIDGAYLLKHPNTRLDRFTRVAENVEGMKAASENIEVPTFASWQFNREAAKKKSATGGPQKGGLEDIAYSDAIGQISSMVLGLFQEDGVETMYQRLIDVLKGRNGETGQFPIHWDWNSMIFDQCMDSAVGASNYADLDFI